MNARSRIYYTLSFETDPPVDGLDLSVDGGVTWHPGEAVEGAPDGWYRWLTRGPDFVPEEGDGIESVFVPYSGVVPLLRYRDQPEVDHKRGPAIYFE